MLCPNCKEPCRYREDRHKWYCGRYRSYSKSKKRKQCSFTASDNRGSSLEKVHVQPWEVILFINHWIQKFWNHRVIVKCLKWSTKTSVDWRSFCAEVATSWVKNQPPIGGPGVVVEIDDTFFVHSKYHRGRDLRQVWLFGGIEREKKDNFFGVPLVDGDEVLDRSAATLVPIIKKLIRPGSVINSDGWAAYRRLAEEGYTHRVINHSETFVDLDDPSIHTQNIKRLWRDVKEWSKRPGLRTEYFEQYFARCLFLHKHTEQTLHHFLIAAAAL